MEARWRRMFEGGSTKSFWISGGIPEVLGRASLPAPSLCHQKSVGKPRILCSPGNFPLLSFPCHNTHYYLSRDQKDYSHHPFDPCSCQPHQNPRPHSSFLISVANQVCFCMSFVLSSLPTLLNSKILEFSRALPKLPISATSSLNVPLFSCLIKA